MSPIGCRISTLVGTDCWSEYSRCFPEEFGQNGSRLIPAILRQVKRDKKQIHIKPGCNLKQYNLNYAVSHSSCMNASFLRWLNVSVRSLFRSERTISVTFFKKNGIKMLSLFWKKEAVIGKYCSVQVQRKNRTLLFTMWSRLELPDSSIVFCFIFAICFTVAHIFALETPQSSSGFNCGVLVAL